MDLEDKLIILIEECSEVIHAATKCLRFGYDIDHGIGYGNNKDVLSRELGDLLGMIEVIPFNEKITEEAKNSKYDRIIYNKQHFPKNNI